MNPVKLMQLKPLWDRFLAGHPKVMPFFRAVYRHALGKDTTIEITVTNAEGRTYTSRIRLTEADMELFRNAQELFQ